MKVSISVLISLVLTQSVEARTWRRPSMMTIQSSSSLPYRSLGCRGGSDKTQAGADHIDVGFTVPTTTTTTTTIDSPSSIPPRGGSTTTTKQGLPPSLTSLPPGAMSTSFTGSISTSTLVSTSSMSASTTTRTVVPTSMVTSSLKSDASADHQTHKQIAKKLKNRNHTNLRRKVMHASFGFFFAALNHFIPKATFVPGMTILTSATLLMELLRYRKTFSWMNDILHFVLGSSLRKHEMDGKFTGSFYYFLGVTVTAALYPTSCATLGICQLAIADPTASYFGRATRHVYWSRIENGLGGLGRNKGILGFLGGALACVPMNYELLSRAQFSAPPTQLLMASALLGLAGAFADLAVPTPTLTLPKKVLGVRVPPFHVDDNFVVPVFSGYACTLIFRHFNFPADLNLAKFLIW